MMIIMITIMTARTVTVTAVSDGRGGGGARASPGAGPRGRAGVGGRCHGAGHESRWLPVRFAGQSAEFNLKLALSLRPAPG